MLSIPYLLRAATWRGTIVSREQYCYAGLLIFFYLYRMHLYASET